jgi:glycosyltransferase involved in cell wall biosynthesis
MAGRGDIELITAPLTQAEMDALHDRAGLFLSLHRAEGFGLGIAETLSRGRAVLATDWSANVEFMPEARECRVDYRLVEIPPRTPIYGGHAARWAEPDLDDAAVKLRALVQDPALRRRIGTEGAALIAANLAPWSRERLLARLSLG